MADSEQRPVEIILARRLMTNLATPACLIDVGGLVFFNDAAAGALGLRFEDAMTMSAADWDAAVRPVGEDGERLPAEEIPLFIALHEERPAHRRMRVRLGSGGERDFEISAIPIASGEGARAALALFWETAPPA